MARRQTWDSNGNLIEDLEVDERVIEPDRVAALEAELAALKSRSTAIEAKLDIVPEWSVGEAVDIGDRRSYEGTIYTVIQSHTTQADWTPDVTPALWDSNF